MMMTIVNNPGDWSHIYAPLEHAAWNGWTPTDLVFPFFLFIVGISVVLANPNRTVQWEKTLTRFMRIFLLGLALSFFSKIKIPGVGNLVLLSVRLLFTVLITFLLLGNYSSKKQFWAAFILLLVALILCFYGGESFESIRIPGVLQRISIVFLIISVAYVWLSTVQIFWLGITFLLLYWGLMTLIPIPGVGSANLEMGTNLAAYVDNLLLPGHLWVTTKTWDPEGVLSTIPAISTGIAGILAGKILIQNANPFKFLLGIGIILIGIGFAWDNVFPINKSLWSSSFVVLSAGWAMFLLSLLYGIIEVLGVKKWTNIFLIFGINPMLVFFYSGIIPRALNLIKVDQISNLEHQEIGIVPWLYRVGIQPYFENPLNSSLAGAVVYLLIWYLILYIFYRKNLIFKV